MGQVGVNHLQGLHLVQSTSLDLSRSTRVISSRTAGRAEKRAEQNHGRIGHLLGQSWVTIAEVLDCGTQSTGR